MTQRKVQRQDKKKKFAVEGLTLVTLVDGISIASSGDSSSNHSADGGVHSGSVSSRGEDGNLAFL